jgi:hypothetical protein
MKDPTDVFGVEISQHLCESMRMLPENDLKEFLQRCKQQQYARLDGCTTADERLIVQTRAQFVEEWKKFFHTLLTRPQK